MQTKWNTKTTLAIAISGLLTACGGGSSSGGSTPATGTINTKPTWLGTVVSASYDGSSDDLLTAGLGKTGLAGALPAYANAAAPTAKELRRAAIYNNYRALVDMTATGGYGSLYGPNVDLNGGNTLGEGKIAGEEHLAFADDGTGSQNVTLMVQIPASFNPAAPCVVTATSSGSRGVYGAIGVAGEWGLKRGCAVAYADKGTGMGIHDLVGDTVNLIDGTRASRATAGKNSNFSAALSDTERSAFLAANPNRVAIKQVHSQQNPEKDWGRDTLRAVEFAFWVINEKYGTVAGDLKSRYADVATPAKATVIAASVSNGGGAALLATEQDSKGLIDGVAVGEPQIQPNDVSGLGITQGGRTQVAIGKPLIDYFTLANLYQPCAAQSARLAGANSASGTFVNAALGSNRCTALAGAGLVTGTTLEERAADAYNKLIAGGWTPEADALHASHYGLNATLGVTLAYVNAYGKFSVKDNVCGYSYAFTDATGSVIAPLANNLAGIFGNGNGVPPTGGISIVNNLSLGGAKADAFSVSAGSGLADYNLDGAICLRKLATGKDPATGAALTGDMKTMADRVAAGVKEVLATAKLRSVPTIIVAGRSDALIPVNHASRAYTALNRKVEGSASKLSYVEVTNGQHFDAFLGLGGFPTRYIPLHVYGIRALDAMWAHLKTGAALPASQVVRTTPRTDATATLTAAQLPAIVATPAAANSISFSNNVLSIPD